MGRSPNLIITLPLPHVPHPNAARLGAPRPATAHAHTACPRAVKVFANAISAFEASNESKRGLKITISHNVRISLRAQKNFSQSSRTAWDGCLCVANDVKSGRPVLVAFLDS